MVSSLDRGGGHRAACAPSTDLALGFTAGRSAAVNRSGRSGGLCCTTAALGQQGVGYRLPSETGPDERANRKVSGRRRPSRRWLERQRHGEQANQEPENREGLHTSPAAVKVRSALRDLHALSPESVPQRRVVAATLMLWPPCAGRLSVAETSCPIEPTNSPDKNAYREDDRFTPSSQLSIAVRRNNCNRPRRMTGSLW